MAEPRIVRVFDAPREPVYQCWTIGEHMQKWSCPNGFTISFGEQDVRPGGKWRAGVTHPEGYELRLSGEYKEVMENEHLLYTHSWENPDGTTGVEMLISIDFKDVDGKCEMTFVQTGFDSIESRDGHESGWNESFDKLERHIEDEMSKK